MLVSLSDGVRSVSEMQKSGGRLSLLAPAALDSQAVGSDGEEAMTNHEESTGELALLRAAFESLQAEIRELRDADSMRPKRRTSGRRRATQRAAVLGGIALVAGIMGVAGASTPGHPADVTFIALSVPHKVLSNASIAKAATNSPVVIGASTTVPSDATSVQMTVAVKSTAAGTLTVFPTDHAASSTADTISFPSGNALATQVTKQSPGLAGKVSFKNNGAATANVTVTITGYSTQTTASNVSGSGGSAGQVLTNNGAGGASWQSVGTGGPAGGVLIGSYPNPGLAANSVNTANLVNGSVSAAKLSAAGSTAGQVLTSTGGGVSWTNPTVPGYQLVQSALLFVNAHTQASGTASCPAGKVVVGGGVESGATAPGVQDVNSSYPINSTTWQAYVDNVDVTSHSYLVFAVCAAGS